MKLFFALSPFLALSAFAVTVKDCPVDLGVKLSGFHVSASLEEVYKEASPGGRVENLNGVEKTAIGNAYNSLNAIKTLGLAHFDLEKARSGRCTYGEGNDRAELYTRGGKDILWIQSELGPRGILLRNYFNVKSVKKTGITLADESRGGMALAIPRYPYTNYSAGGDLFFVGKVVAEITSSSDVAEVAQIHAKDEGWNPVVVSLDEEGVPRLKGDKKFRPSIKDFRDESDHWEEACYVGSNTAVRTLLEALVDAANGDGDSWAIINTINYFPKTGTFTVKVNLEDESGEHTESFRFSPCKD